jgi:hypothetical protein
MKTFKIDEKKIKKISSGGFHSLILIQGFKKIKKK